MPEIRASAIYQDLERRYNSIVEATMKQSDEISELKDEVAHLTRENSRITGELKSAQHHAQLLGDAMNEQNQDNGTEIERLRKLLKKNGINPESN